MIEPFDILIIGGGVNGTGLSRDLAMRGFRTCLVEQRDLASGASGANSGMIHGGLRYLRHDRKVTSLSSLDSGYIQRIVPHLLFRIPFLFVVTSDDPSSPSLRSRALSYGVEVYFGAYDLYQPRKRGLPSATLTPDEAYSLEPGLRRNVVRAFSTDEWGIDPWRLCLLNAESARRHGASIRLYAQVVRLIRGEGGAVTGAELRDPLTGSTSAVSARLVFNCTGAWGPKIAALAGVEIKLRPGKGIHLLLDRRLSNYGVICPAVDGREIFIMPYGESSLIGTTDDDYYGDPDDLHATQDEIEYLLEGIETAIPRVREATVARTYVGLRSTLHEYGTPEGALSREHAIYDHAAAGAPGFLTLVGGKLASYRIQSQDAADLVARRLGREVPCRTHLEPLPGGERFPDIAAASAQYRVPELTVSRIAHRHGANTEAILDLTMMEPSLRAQLCACEQVIRAEAAWCIREEMIRTLPDLSRRCRVGWGSCQGARCGAAAAQLFARERKLDVEQSHRQLLLFLEDRLRQRRGILAGSQLATEELNRGIHFTLGNLDGSYRT